MSFWIRKYNFSPTRHFLAFFGFKKRIYCYFHCNKSFYKEINIGWISLKWQLTQSKSKTHHQEMCMISSIVLLLTLIEHNMVFKRYIISLYLLMNTMQMNPLIQILRRCCLKWAIFIMTMICRFAVILFHALFYLLFVKNTSVFRN